MTLNLIRIAIILILNLITYFLPNANLLIDSAKKYATINNSTY